MTRPVAVRFLRTQTTMAYPDGRLLAQREAQLFVLAPDGWATVPPNRPPGSVDLTRAQAEAWCAQHDVPADRLDAVPEL
jgi:hypothetical protein